MGAHNKRMILRWPGKHRKSPTTYRRMIFNKMFDDFTLAICTDIRRHGSLRTHLFKRAADEIDVKTNCPGRPRTHPAIAHERIHGARKRVAGHLGRTEMDLVGQA